jgi:hypothetical protein
MIFARLEAGILVSINYNYLKSLMLSALQWVNPLFTAAMLILFAFGILLICYNWIFISHKTIESEEA